MKLVLPGTVVFVTTSIAQGLPLVAAPFMRSIILSTAARAQFLEPVTICDVIVSSNHIHLIMVVGDPQVFVDFFERFKTETAHAINRLLGRKNVSVWCSGFDNPIILTLDTAIKQITYIYNNPTKDNFTDTIEEYPNFNTWDIRKSATDKTISCPRIRRYHLKKLEDLQMTRSEQERFNKELLALTKSSHDLIIKPNAWLKAFNVSDPAEINRINQDIIDSVRVNEQAYRLERIRDNKKVIGRERLLDAAIDTDFVSKRSGKRMLCISSVISLRIDFIARAKDLFAQGRQVYRAWLRFERDVAYPIGLFPPAMPKNANLMVGAFLA